MISIAAKWQWINNGAEGGEGYTSVGFKEFIKGNDLKIYLFNADKSQQRPSKTPQIPPITTLAISSTVLLDLLHKINQTTDYYFKKVI